MVPSARVVGRRAIRPRGRPGSQRGPGPSGPAGPRDPDPQPTSTRWPARPRLRVPSSRRTGTPMRSPRHPVPTRAPACPAFDIVLLGIGPDAHVASLFPEHPALHETDRMTVAVHGSPKPPPTRVSLTLPAITLGAGGMAGGRRRGEGASRTPGAGSPRRTPAGPGVGGARSAADVVPRGRGGGVPAAPGPAAHRQPLTRVRPARYFESPRSLLSASSRIDAPSRSVRRSRT